MMIYCIGNRLIQKDSVPLKLLPKLQREFPDIVCLEADPNENFIPEKGAIIIDAVQGIKDITLFQTLEDFSGHKLITAHDYDVYTHLLLLHKLHKLPDIVIIGIPQIPFTERLFQKLIDLLRNIKSIQTQ